MARLIAHKALDKMVNYETGKWRFYGGVDHRNVNEIIAKLEEQGTEFKYYYVSTRIAGIYDHVIIVKK
jgi:ribulose bisphosphate carboxylase small subunit